MPIYNCIAPAGRVSMEARKKIAKAITDVHCGSTNAPRSFVHVFFREIPADSKSDTGVETPYYIDGVNRAGRKTDVVLELKSDLRKAYADIAGVPLDQVGASISEVPASWVMEGGAILPEPGEEGEEWYAAEAAH
jgi:phenylpyruvate tautomerase PptA (4-oxalocrotonate tautomerase family)